MSHSIEVDSQFMVTCSVCLSDYDGESRKQKFLPCLHSFCQSCLTQVKQFDRIKCPICRNELRILSGDVSSLPNTYFESLKEMEKKMKEIELKARNQARKIEELKQEKEEISEEMKRKIAKQCEKINQLRCSNNRLDNESTELKRVKKFMETTIAIKDQQIYSLNEFVIENELGKKLETYQKRQAEEQFARLQVMLEGDKSEEFLELLDEDRDNESIDLEEDIEEQLSSNELRDIDALEEGIKEKFTFSFVF